MTDTTTDYSDSAFDRGMALEAAGPAGSLKAGSLAAGRRLVDRRRRPTPMLSRYWLRGRRRQSGRREGDSPHVYVDRYTRAEVGVAAWLAAASLSDLGLTILHLRGGGTEANPIMDWFLTQGGTPAFAAAKIAMTAVPVLFLLLHARFRGTWPALLGLSAMYGVLLGYHALAAWDRLAG